MSEKAAQAAAAANIAQARAIVIAASQLTWSLYVSGDLSVDQHGPISLALSVAEAGIKDVEELMDRLQAARAWIRKAGHLGDCALQYGGACSCGKSDLTRGGSDGS